MRRVRHRIPEVPFRDFAEPFAILLSDELTHEAEDALTEEAKNLPPAAGFIQVLRIVDHDVGRDQDDDPIEDGDQAPPADR